MSEVTQLLQAVEDGDALAAERLLPIVYHELRKLAAHKLAREKPGQTLEATALVHEVYLRLVGASAPQRWESRGHFFAAAAEAMRRILVESARRKQTLKRGGDCIRVDLPPDEFPHEIQADPLELLAVHESLERLAAKSSRTAELVKLRYFLGCTLEEAAEVLGIAHATAEQEWTYARAWLRREWRRGEEIP
jgi:RNA polymerase sigma factor (TIGR02999 family)